MPRAEKKTSEVNVEDDDVYDEIDQFHMQRDGIFLNNSAKRIKNAQKEVLSVQVEDSEDDEDSDDEELQGAQSNEAEVPISINKWGKKRAGYYELPM
uniref:Uncharacterized protein n=1 Tax=Ditylenchus dipsaci TaxID=166011 RepID=A0A915EPS3_9BILA